MGDFFATIIGTDLLSNALFALRAINLIIAAILAYEMASLSMKKKGASLEKTFRILTLTFFVMALIFIIRIFSVLPGWGWDALEVVAQLAFMLTIASVIMKLQSAIDAYEFISKRSGPRKGFR